MVGGGKETHESELDERESEKSEDDGWEYVEGTAEPEEEAGDDKEVDDRDGVGRVEGGGDVGEEEGVGEVDEEMEENVVADGMKEVSEGEIVEDVTRLDEDGESDGRELEDGTEAEGNGEDDSDIDGEGTSIGVDERVEENDEVGELEGNGEDEEIEDWPAESLGGGTEVTGEGETEGETEGLVGTSEDSEELERSEMETGDEMGFVGGREGGSVEAEDTGRILDEEVGLEELERGIEGESWLVVPEEGRERSVEESDGCDTEGRGRLVEGKEVGGKEVGGKEVGGKEVEGEEVEGKEVEIKEVEGNEMDGNEIEGKEIGGTGMRSGTV
ncbi:hypothetical protein NLI96_g5154 [Meripilus lineatus]|uniref:Uncharacterized protein n=1 Tax=Meripilus lineatus TaxID=2056292 RepID=A0AAD5V3I5_9APHY|nr:hypothetical protein NLI96_g5154 [Physisporinus lineatus]